MKFCLLHLAEGADAFIGSSAARIPTRSSTFDEANFQESREEVRLQEKKEVSREDVSLKIIHHFYGIVDCLAGKAAIIPTEIGKFQSDVSTPVSDETALYRVPPKKIALY